MSDGPGTAPIVPCPNCGAPLRVELGQSAVRCGSCNVDVEVPAAVREQARAYFDALGSERQLEHFEIERAELYTTRARRPIRALWFFACAVLAGFWLIALPSGLAVGMGAWADLVLVAASAIVANRLLSTLVSRRARPSSSESDLAWTATCENCGSSIRFAPGATEARCPFCQATALAPQALEQARVRRAAERTQVATAEADSAAADSELETRDDSSRDAILIGLVLAAVLVWHLTQTTRTRLAHRQIVLLLTIAVVAGAAGPVLDSFRK